MFRADCYPIFLRILHRHFRAAENRVLEMLDRDHHAGGDSRQISRSRQLSFGRGTAIAMIKTRMTNDE